jgi:hypothetical protein
VVPESPEPQQGEDVKDDYEEYAPLSDSEYEKLYCNANERDSYGVEAPIPIGRLQALLVHLGITTTPKYQIKGVTCLGRVEYHAIAEIFSRSRVISRHQGPTFWALTSDAMADAAWQFITSWSCH